MLDVNCPNCGETYHIKAENVGRNLKCRRCDTVFELRAPAAAAAASGANGQAAAAAGGAPVEVTDANFDQRVLGSPQPVLVDFWATWCPPCRAIAPALEELAKEYAGRVTIAKLNADENPRAMSRFGVMGLPTLLIFKNGQEADRLIGLRPKAAIKQALQRVA